ncbi:MAG TPA: hypothetical protein VIF88_05830 [Methylocystis sp.]
MLVRLILFIAILLQVAGVSTVAARAQSHSLAFRAVICKSDASPLAPYAPGEHDGSCADCIACCDAQPQILCVYDQVARLSFPTARFSVLALPILLVSPTQSETPPARASPV